MALTILSSNRVETLQARLTHQLAETPLDDPFTREIVVVPTYAMARWLNLRIAQQQGIAANIHYPLVQDWIWQQAHGILADVAEQDPYSAQALYWKIFNLLPGLLEQDAFAALRTYLDDDNNGIKRLQLAQRIAVTLDRYQLYRPQQILDWSNGAETHWQAILWRKITAAGKRHRVEIISDVINRLEDDVVDVPLPQRISLFAMSRLAPVFIEFIHALASQTRILMYQHNPTDQYWADLVSEKEQARRRLQNPDHAEYLDTSNNLLTSWGKQGQQMQDLLLDLGPVINNEVEENHPPGNDSLLQRLQGSLFNLDLPATGFRADGSISVQVCHSAMRECQVLHDHLLDLLDRHPELSTEDILVMVPEISHYAPYIEAVFQFDGSGRRPNLAWNISDISVSDAHPLVRIFIQLLKLPASRFTRSEVMAYLECAEIRRLFGIDLEMLDEIHRLVDAAQLRWGIDASQRQEMGLSAIHENTWQQAWERLFAGYAMGDIGLWQGIAPIADVDSDSAAAIARMRYLFERLLHWRQKLEVAASAENWQQRLHQLIEEFFAAPGLVDDPLQPLRNAISALGETGVEMLSPALVGYWMDKQLATDQQPGRLYSGGITFCGMQPMRNIPFPVICVMGMQDQAFPRRDQLAEFDLMRDHWRPGDPQHGDEDRYLMLETLLCARHHLYFSYCGRSLRDNSECQPSVLLREMFDYIDSCSEPDNDGRRLSEQITRLQPMQAFSRKNFSAACPGYDQYWHETSIHLESRQQVNQTPGWKNTKLKLAGDAETGVDLASLVQFFSHPLRYFFNTRLGIRIPQQQVTEDEESFSLQGLQKWALAEQFAHNMLHRKPYDAQQFSAQGLLPHGSAAANEWASIQTEYQDLLRRLEAFRDETPQARLIECRFDSEQRLSGEVRACYAGTGLMHFSASKTIKSRAVISLWLQHLALSASDQLAPTETSQLLIPGKPVLSFEPLEASHATMLLRGYIELFLEGLEYPLPVFPNTSYAWASQTDPERAMQKALDAWNGGNYANAPAGECEDAFVRLALHNNTTQALEDPQFQACARLIYQPLIEQGG